MGLAGLGSIVVAFGGFCFRSVGEVSGEVWMKGLGFACELLDG